jgi:DNA polymerase-3 subunit alpha (Gram-positive type)
MEDARSEDMMNVMLSFLNGDTNGIPEFECDYIKKLIEKTSPTDYNELLKIFGFVHGSNVWANNADGLFAEKRMTLAEIPAFWEDVYNEIAKRLVGNGIYEDGFAYEVAKKAKLGSYALNGEVDNITVSGLLSLGFNLDFIFFIEKVRYMFPKHHAIVCLKYAIAFMWYKIHHKAEFDIIMGESK